MRILPLILGLALVAVLTGLEVYDFFVTNDGIGYFASHPRRLLYVAVIGIAGGLLALAFSRVSSVSRRVLRLVVLGGIGACVTAYLAVFSARLASLPPMETEFAIWGGVAATLGSLSIVAALVWLEFYLVWSRRGVSESDH